MQTCQIFGFDSAEKKYDNHELLQVQRMNTVIGNTYMKGKKQDEVEPK